MVTIIYSKVHLVLGGSEPPGDEVTKKCLPMYVYKHIPYIQEGYDPTNGGISSEVDTIYVECPTGFIDIEDDDPALMKPVFRAMGGREIVHLEPVNSPPEGHTPWMAGGNYAESCDSRIDELLHGFYGAVSIHDRTETWEQYEFLSR